jgi:hypothetical protein
MVYKLLLGGIRVGVAVSELPQPPAKATRRTASPNRKLELLESA